MTIINNNNQNEIIFESKDDENNEVSAINQATLKNDENIFLLYLSAKFTNDLLTKLMSILNKTTWVKAILVSNENKQILLTNCGVQWEDTAQALKIIGSCIWNKASQGFNTDVQNLKVRKIIF